MSNSNYWNPYSTYNPSGLTDTSTSTNFGNYYYDTAIPWTNSAYHYYQPIVTIRKILVHHPDHWTEEQGLKFVELINIKTKTGFTVTLLIKGKVLITDPDVEQREMNDFVPLLQKRASGTDLQIINKFFEENPCLKSE
jgi:hypothetical protein